MDSRKTYFANLNIPDNKRTKIDMDYKEKYEEAYKLYHSEETTKDQKYVIERLFPELAESEDERIRKGLIEYFLHYPDHEITYYGLKSDSVISWLEKQGEQILANSAKTCKDEQKPADKVEPFDKYKGLTDFERTLADICIGWIGEELGWKQYIKDNADVLLKIAIKKFNSVQDVPFKQKPAWSEEDELYIRELESLVKQVWATAEHKNDKDTIHKMSDLSFFLKTLKPQNRWKPSEEQMKALQTAIGIVGELTPTASLLKEIREQLKKLKG